jgi:iron complex transport system substrate-binding protein
VRDTEGRAIQLNEPAQRIVVCGADIAKVLVMIGANDQIVGVTSAVKSSPQIKEVMANKDLVGDDPNVEKILSLDPDIILLYSSSKPANIEQIKKINTTIGFFDCYKLENLSSDILSIGKLTGKEKQSAELVTNIDGIIHLVKERTANLSESEKPKVYFEWGDYTAMGSNSGGDILIRTAGGRNIAGITSLQWVQVSPDWIIAEDPDVVIKVLKPDVELSAFQTKFDTLVTRTGMNQVSAIRMNRTYVISQQALYGPQSAIGLLYMAKILHPDRFSDIDPEYYSEMIDTRFGNGINTSINLYPTLE